jgi:hypothetical protein
MDGKTDEQIDRHSSRSISRQIQLTNEQTVEQMGGKTDEQIGNIQVVRYNSQTDRLVQNH